MDESLFDDENYIIASLSIFITNPVKIYSDILKGDMIYPEYIENSLSHFVIKDEEKGYTRVKKDYVTSLYLSPVEEK